MNIMGKRNTEITIFRKIIIVILPTGYSPAKLHIIPKSNYRCNLGISVRIALPPHTPHTPHLSNGFLIDIAKAHAQ